MKSFTKSAKPIVSDLLKYRQDKQMTQRGLARKIKTSTHSLWSIEKYHREPMLNTLFKYANALGLKLNVYYELVEEKNNDKE